MQATELRDRNKQPMRVLFVMTSMPVGGAETLLVNLVRKLDRHVCMPELVCLKAFGPLGEELAHEIPAFSHFLTSKFDVSVLPRLVAHLRRRRIDAVITVGAGDKMFWGRLAAWWAGVPVICAALHSTGWPDGVGRLNRYLTPLTDAFIAVAKPHAEFMEKFEKFPKQKIEVIPNGVDTGRFRPNAAARADVRRELALGPESQLIGILAALRPEKNHSLFVRAAQRVASIHPHVHFVVIGDGPERPAIESCISDCGLRERFHLLGTRSDTERLLATLDVVALTSHNEANPVSILEGLACGVPVVATNVGSVAENVRNQQTGFLVPPDNTSEMADGWLRLLNDPALANRLGKNGREWVIQTGSLESMVDGYQQMLIRLWNRKCPRIVVREKRTSYPAVSPHTLS